MGSRFDCVAKASLESMAGRPANLYLEMGTKHASQCMNFNGNVTSI